MPTYEYRCTNCSKTTDAVRRVAERDDAPRCSLCCAPTVRRITPTMVSVFTPYRAVAADKESGEYPVIRSKGEHQAFLSRNGYEEVGNDKSMAPLPMDEVRHRRAEKIKEMQSDPGCEYTFDPVTHEAIPKPEGVPA